MRFFVFGFSLFENVVIISFRRLVKIIAWQFCVAVTVTWWKIQPVPLFIRSLLKSLDSSFIFVSFRWRVYMRRLFAYVMDLAKFSNDMVFVLSPLPINYCFRTSAESFRVCVCVSFLFHFQVAMNGPIHYDLNSFLFILVSLFLSFLFRFRARKIVSYFIFRCAQIQTNEQKRNKIAQMWSDLMKNYQYVGVMSCFISINDNRWISHGGIHISAWEWK